MIFIESCTRRPLEAPAPDGFHASGGGKQKRAHRIHHELCCQPLSPVPSCGPGRWLCAIQSLRLRKKSQSPFPFMVRYLTTNGESGTYACFEAFALRYRRVNATFYREHTPVGEGVTCPTIALAKADPLPRSMTTGSRDPSVPLPPPLTPPTRAGE